MPRDAYAYMGAGAGPVILLSAGEGLGQSLQRARWRNLWTSTPDAPRAELCHHKDGYNRPLPWPRTRTSTCKHAAVSVGVRKTVRRRIRQKARRRLGTGREFRGQESSRLGSRTGGLGDYVMSLQNVIRMKIVYGPARGPNRSTAPLFHRARSG